MSENETNYAGRKASFNRIAQLYEDRRPPYPSELADAVIAYAGLRPDSRLLEIGSGTGKGTELFARRGHSILCLEPGETLLALAAEKLRDDPNVMFVQTTFENWPLEESAFDLVYAAQSFHWIAPEIGYTKSAQALKPGGTLALFWNTSPPFDHPAFLEGQEVYKRVAPELLAGSGKEPFTDWVERHAIPLRASAGFQDITIEQFPFTVRYTATEYVEMLNTHSTHQSLPEDVRAELCTGIAEAVERHGGVIENPYVAALYLARTA